jgi:hypothetical protein
MRHQHIATLMSSSVLGVALVISSPWNAEAATLNTGDFPDANFSIISDTPTFLDLRFESPLASSKDLIPIGEPIPIYGGERVLLGPILPVFSSENWNVSVQNEAGFRLRGGRVNITSLFVEQVIPGQSDVPQGEFVTSGFIDNRPPSIQKLSYLADSPAGVFSTLSPDGTVPPGSPKEAFFNGNTCPPGSSNCVSYELTSDSSIQDPKFELRGLFQPTDSEPVPEPSSIVGSLAALLALFGFTKIRKSLSKV